MKFRKKPVVVVVEAITFDELVEHGKANSPVLVRGMPWSFDYKGHPITHENDDCYLIPTGAGTVRFERGDMLVTDDSGLIQRYKPDIFALLYEPAATRAIAQSIKNTGSPMSDGQRKRKNTATNKLLARIASLEADSSRLDWLEANWERRNSRHFKDVINLREAIDAARNPVATPEVLATSEGDNDS